MGVHDGHRERKREQFLRHGADSFADHELLELLLYSAVPRRDTNPLAHDLINYFGSLHAVFSAPAEELQKFSGISQSGAVLLKLIPSIYRRAALSAGENEQILTADMDLNVVEDVRNRINVYRDRIPEAYRL